MGFFNEEDDDKGGFFGHIIEEQEKFKLGAIGRRVLGRPAPSVTEMMLGFKPGLPEPEPSVSVAETARVADEDRLKKHPGGTLGAIIEGGLLAATNRPVPAELAAAAGRQGETIDLRNVTDTESLGAAEKAVVLGGRVGEGVRRGLDAITDTGRGFFGVGPEVHAKSPIRSLEDKRIVSQANTGLEQIADIVGESIPEVGITLATGGASGINRALGKGIEEATESRIKRFLLNRAANLAQNIGETTILRGDVPSAGQAGAMLALDTALGSIGPAGRGAKSVVRRVFGEATDDIHRAVANSGNLDVAGSGILRAVEQEAAALEIRGSAPVNQAGAIAPGRIRFADEPGGPAVGGRVPEQTFLGQAPITPGRATIDQSGASASPIIRFADQPVSAPGTTKVFNVPLGATSNAPGSLRAALEASIAKETGEAAPEVAAKALDSAGPAAPDMAIGAAALPDGRARANYLRNVADDPDIKILAAEDAAIPPGEVGSLSPKPAIRAALNLLRKEELGKKFSEYYVNSALLVPGPNMVNLANNVQNILTLPLVRTVEASLAGAQRTTNAISQFLFKKQLFDNPGQATFIEVYRILQGYLTGVKHFTDSVRDIGRLHRAKEEAANTLEVGIRDLSKQDVDAIDSLLKADADQFASGWQNYVYGARALFGENDDIARALPSEELRTEGGIKGAEGIRKTFIEGTKGRALRSATTSLQISDAAAKDAVFFGEKAAMVNRMARKHNVSEEFILGPPPKDTALAEKWAEINSEIIDAASKQARYQTLTNELGPVLKKALELRNSLGALGTLIQPFFTTPANAVKFIFRHSPVGLAEDAVRIGFRELTGRGEARTPDQVIESVSRGIVGTGLMTGVYGLLANGIVGDDTADPENENFIGITGSPISGAEGRTSEAAEGGVRTGYTLRIGDRHIDLRRLGLVGMIMGNTVDVLKRYRDLQMERIERNEVMDERGAWEDRDRAWMETIKGGLNAGAFGISSVTSNNLFNETALSDTLDVLNQLNIAGRKGDEDALNRIADKLVEIGARGAQPFTALAHASTALEEPITTPNPQEGILGRFEQAVDKRLPFGLDLGLSKDEPVAQVDIFGQERVPRFLGDQSDSFATRLASKLFFPLGGASEETGDQERDRNAIIAKEMRRLGVSKDFPKLTERMESLFPDSDTIKHTQMVRGEFRWFFAEDLIKSPEYLAATDEERKAGLQRALNIADSKSAEIVGNLLEKQAIERRPLDIRELDSAIIEALDLEFPPRKTEDEPFQLIQQ